MVINTVITMTMGIRNNINQLVFLKKVTPVGFDFYYSFYNSLMILRQELSYDSRSHACYVFWARAIVQLNLHVTTMHLNFHTHSQNRYIIV